MSKQRGISRGKSLRLSDFADRAKAPRAMFDAGQLGRYVAVHPIADESELLQELGMTPAECYKVDCYWLKDDVYLSTSFAIMLHRRVASAFGRDAAPRNRGR